MPNYRAEATFRDIDGTVQVVAERYFEAKSVSDVERFADRWAMRIELTVGNIILRVINNDLISSERVVGAEKWTRSDRLSNFYRRRRIPSPSRSLASKPDLEKMRKPAKI